MLDRAPHPTRPAGRIIALVGAESSGKSTLAAALAPRLHALTGLRCTWVPEYLREWCDAHQRTPCHDEQAHIAAEQAARLDQAAAEFDLVLADTTPLMTAVYHRQVFGDRSMEANALNWHRRCQLTLLMALDLPWQADGIQRDSPDVQVPVDAALRDLLISACLPFVVVSGWGEQRLEAAVDALAPALRLRKTPHSGLLSRLQAREAAQPAWRWLCETCDQPECEHAAFLERRPAELLQRR
jgi:nicotinamide riboside kinase